MGKATVDRRLERVLAQMGEDPSSFLRVTPTVQSEWLATTKYSSVPPVLSPKLSKALELAQEWIVQDLAPYVESRVATFDEVFQYLDLSKNPGWPNCEEDLTKLGSLTREEWVKWFFEHYYPSLFTDEQILAFKTIFVKTELRKRDKVEKDDLRTIQGQSLWMVVACDKFDLKFNLDFIKFGRTGNWSALGLPFTHGGWAAGVLSRLSRLPLHYHYDVTRNDSNFLAFRHKIVERIRQQLSHWDAATKRAHANISLQKRTGPMVMADGTVLWKEDGQDSGQPSTIVDNTLDNYEVLLAAFIDLWFDEFGSYPMKSDFDKNVVAVVGGDDGAFSTSYEVEGWFNPVFIKIWNWNLLGRALKMGDQPVPLDEVEFFSQHTSWKRDFPLPSLNSEKLRASARYGSDDARDVRGTFQRLANLRMISWSDPQLCDWLTSLANALLKRFDLIFQGDARWEEARASFKTESELRGLWLPSYEAAPAPRVECSCSQWHFKSLTAMNQSKKGNAQKDAHVKEFKKLKKAVAKAKAKAKAPAMVKAKKKRKNNKRTAAVKTHVALAPSAVSMDIKSVPFHAVGRNRYRGIEMMSNCYIPSNAVGQFYPLFPYTVLSPESTLLWPKANNVAQLFQKFRIKKSRIIFCPRSNVNTNTSILLLYFPDPSSYNILPATAANARQYKHCVEGSIYQGDDWNPLVLDIRNRSDLTRTFYIGGASGSEVRLESPGAFMVFVDGVDSSSQLRTVGYLYHDYEIEFLEETLPNNASINFSPAGSAWNYVQGLPSTATTVQVPVTLPLVNAISTGSGVVNFGGTVQNIDFWDLATTWEWQRIQIGSSTNYATVPVPPNDPAANPYLATSSAGVFSLSPGQSVVVAFSTTATFLPPAGYTVAGTEGAQFFILYQTPAQQGTGVTGAVAVGPGIANCFTGSTSLATNGTLYNGSSVPYRCWCCWSIGSFAGAYPVNGVTSYQPGSAGTGADYFSLTIDYALAVYAKSGLSRPNVYGSTMYDLQRDADLWQPLFESGSPGKVIITSSLSFLEDEEDELKELTTSARLSELEAKYSDALQIARQNQELARMVLDRFSDKDPNRENAAALFEKGAQLVDGAVVRAKQAIAVMDRLRSAVPLPDSAGVQIAKNAAQAVSRADTLAEREQIVAKAFQAYAASVDPHSTPVSVSDTVDLLDDLPNLDLTKTSL